MYLNIQDKVVKIIIIQDKIALEVVEILNQTQGIEIQTQGIDLLIKDL